MLQRLIMMFLSKRAGGGSLGALLGPLSAMLAGGSGGGAGGLGDILGKFQTAGLGAKADSWVGTGRNKSLSARDVRTALGDDEVSRIAREAGISERKAAGGLAALLPKVIDKATPGGQLPGSTSDLDLDALKGMLGF